MVLGNCRHQPVLHALWSLSLPVLPTYCLNAQHDAPVFQKKALPYRTLARQVPKRHAKPQSNLKALPADNPPNLPTTSSSLLLLARMPAPQHGAVHASSCTPRTTAFRPSALPTLPSTGAFVPPPLRPSPRLHNGHARTSRTGTRAIPLSATTSPPGERAAGWSGLPPPSPPQYSISTARHTHTHTHTRSLHTPVPPHTHAACAPHGAHTHTHTTAAPPPTTTTRHASRLGPVQASRAFMPGFMPSYIPAIFLG